MYIFKQSVDMCYIIFLKILYSYLKSRIKGASLIFQQNDSLMQFFAKATCILNPQQVNSSIYKYIKVSKITCMVTQFCIVNFKNFSV